MSPGGCDLAMTSQDGRLTVWDGMGRLKHQLAPSAHLACTATCLAWMPAAAIARTRNTSTSSQNGSSPEKSPRNSETLALGTASGTVLIFSLKTGDVTVHLNKKNSPHKGRVNGLAWSSNCIDLYSVGDDGYISHSSVKKCNVVGRFRGSLKGGDSSEALASVALHPSERSLLVGSLSRLTWWDLDTQSALKTFEGGHVGSVSALAVVTSSLNNCYVITGGNSQQKDHTLTAWHLDLKSEDSPSEKSSRAKNSSGLDEMAPPPLKFSVNESVRAIFTSLSGGQASQEGTKSGRSRKTSVGDEEEETTFGVVTHSGVVHTFCHVLATSGGKKRKPVKPKHTLQIATEKAADGSVAAVPVLDARFAGADQLSMVHGSKLAPTFERLELSSMEKLTCLIRTPKALGPKTEEGGATNLVVPETSGVKVLAPGPSMPESSKASKRKKAGQDVEDTISMVDRLRLLSRDDETSRRPQTDSMVQLLLQGLHNGDRRILDSVLDRAGDDVIENTVKKLPVEGVIPLVRELQHYIKGRGMVNQSHSKWLRSTLQVHTGHLMNSPQCSELLGPIYAMLEARTKHYSSLLQLKGKLDIMTKQISAKAEVDPGTDDSAIAKFVYHDESGDEDADLDQMLVCPVPSDTDDNWLMQDEEGSEAAADTDDDDQESEDEEVDLVQDDDEMNSD